MNIRMVTAAGPGRLPLVLAFALEGSKPDAGRELQTAVSACQATGDVKTAFRSVHLFHPRSRGAERLGFVGVGKPKDLTTERLRRAAAVAQAAAEDADCKRFRLVVPAAAIGRIPPAAAGAAIAEGLLLGAYRYLPPQKDKPKARAGQDCEVVLIGGDRRAFAEGFELGRTGANATVLARDLENLPSNLCTPTRLAAEARRLGGGRVRVKVLDRPALERLKMHAFLGVARGSDEPPKFIVLEYAPPRASGTVAVIGKGLTFDSGGISIKPAAKMDEMRYDMCGAGAVLGLFAAIKRGALAGSRDRTRIVGVIPATENMPGGSAQKPGDVVRAMDGHTIEVLNTDAEGRIVLADAIAYAKKFHQPSRIVDLATLTGAVVVALGHEVAGILGNDDKLIAELVTAAKAADEPLWQLPLWDVHKDQVKTKFADVANLNGAHHGCGTIAGAAFLALFAGDTPWAHLDIAGTAWGGMSKDYYRSGASGTAVRTLVHWARSL